MRGLFILFTLVYFSCSDHQFSKISGIELNTAKTEIMRIGEEQVEREYIIEEVNVTMTYHNMIMGFKQENYTIPANTQKPQYKPIH